MSGERNPKPYLREIVQVLKEDLKRTYGNGRAAQEIVDWYTLLGKQRRLKEDDMQRWFPGFPAPIALSLPIAERNDEKFPRWLELRIPQRSLGDHLWAAALATLGWEPYMVPIDDRLDGSSTPGGWHRFVEGLPMAVAILAAVIRARGWAYTCGRFAKASRRAH